MSKAVQNDYPDDFFDAVYKENYNNVFNFIFSITNNPFLTEEITQEAFVKAFINIKSLGNQSKIKVWLNKIAYNLFIDISRKKSSRSLSIDNESLIKQSPEYNNSPLKAVEQKFMSECVQNKILSMPENYRAPLFLDIYGYNNQEIADIIGCSLENVKIRLHRARKKMKEILGHHCRFYHDERNVLC